MKLPGLLIAAVVLVTACQVGGTSIPSAEEETAMPSASSSSAAASPGSTGTRVPTAALPTTLPATPTLAVNSWATVVVDRLNLRERAGTDAPSLGLLSAGMTGMIAAGPVQADGYAWYAFAGPGFPYGSGCATNEDPTLLGCPPTWFGWVASSDAAENPWIAPTELDCPAVPTTVAEAAAIQPGVRLACFGERTLVLDAYLSPLGRGGGCGSDSALTPSWLDICSLVFLQGTATEIEGQGPELPAYAYPDLGSCSYGGRDPESCPFAPYFGEWVEVRGHFDDSAAGQCERHGLGGFGDIAADRAWAIYGCRIAFVVTAVRPAS